ncbi:MAG TPA: histidine kinase dimerization/phosphoacceptor domain -containing protein [Syntrophales bacterium]|nr:histidine kinase dimerization/phosphoacceptor domain -containing protein [Syntrophales bacterium]HPQ42990.1 histidine kinase dimerization/phosphoacceptor domain -containing protein [Syntrophales bacterium]
MTHILIADDSEDSRLILKKTLESNGHRVEEAINGEEALRMAKKSPPGMIISDIFMPVMDGFTLCREWRDDDRLKSIPFIFYTATYSDPQDEKLAFQFGADRFIRKPAEPKEFIAIIQDVIRDMEKGRAPSDKPTVEEEKDAFKLYSERLVNKLEKKMLDLEKEIARRKETEESLRMSEKRFREIADLLPQIVFETDEEGNFTFVNHNAFDAFGYTCEDLDKGLHPLQMVVPDDRDRGGKDIRTVLNGDRVEGIEYTALRKDGRSFPILIYASPIIQDNGVRGMRGILVDITDRKETEKKMRRSLREKEILLAEIHHRVKNNMQIISSLLSLQSRDIYDERALSLIRNCEDRIRSLALVHEKLYLSEDLSMVDFNNYMQDLAIRLFQTYGVDTRVIQFSSQIQDVYFNIETAIPLGLISSELISNSLKHAFPEGREGTISAGLYFDKETERYTLTITDDGIGFPEEIDYHNPSTFGLQLVDMLTKQLGGTIELDRSTGTSFTMILREQQYKRRI